MKTERGGEEVFWNPAGRSRSQFLCRSKDKHMNKNITMSKSENGCVSEDINRN